MRDVLALGEALVAEPAQRVRAAGTALEVVAAQPRGRSAQIQQHYDVGNEFYALWLDRNRVYSCAYFTLARRLARRSRRSTSSTTSAAS